MTRVCLVSMPFGAVERPSLALGLLQALLEEAGIPCRSLYANLEWARRVGPDRYGLWEETLGDVVFSRAAFPDLREDAEPFMAWRLEHRRSKARGLGLPEDLLGEAVRLRQEAVRFIGETAREAVATGAAIFGCTSSYWQQTASLALLREIRRLRPDAITMLGGVNCEGVMGRAVHRLFPWVDFVVSGEPDDFFAPWCRALLEEGRNLEELPEGVFGPAHRVRGYPAGVPRALCRNLESLPTPQFRDYFAALRDGGLEGLIHPGLPIETSRGCWWGQVHHCRFCGTSEAGRRFRSKSAARVLAEFDDLQARHGLADFEVTDSIMDMGYFRTLLPELAARGGRRIFWEVKSNLKRSQVGLLARAGVTWIQPGIEALDSRVLGLVDKGVTAGQNVLLLKWCREHGVAASWNLLWGFPGEEDEWYADAARFVPRLAHLQPPRGMIRLRFDRYGEYQQRPGDFGLRLRPARYLRLAYGLSREDLEELAYFHEPSEAMGPAGPGVRNLSEAVARWTRRFWSLLPPILSLVDDGETLHLLDTRVEAEVRTLRLDGDLRAVYLRAEEGIPRAEAGPEEAVRTLEDLGLLLSLDGRVLGLAVRGSLPRLPRWGEFPGGRVDGSAARRSREAQAGAPSGTPL